MEGNARERRGSTGGLEEFLRGKRGRVEEKGEEEVIFKTSKKTASSPTGRKLEDLESIIREWSKEIKEVLEEARGIRGIKEEMIKMKDLREEVREQGSYVSREVEEMRREIKELREREEKWQGERRELKGRIENLERKMEDREKTDGRGGQALEEGTEKGFRNRMKEIEWIMERKERKERRRHVIVTSMEIEEGMERVALEEILK